jgi:hypothetical protein
MHYFNMQILFNSFLLLRLGWGYLEAWKVIIMVQDRLSEKSIVELVRPKKKMLKYVIAPPT